MYLVHKDDYALRPMKEDDLTLVLEWRNSDRIRAVMYTDQYISLDEHYQWYKKVAANDQCCYFIFTIKGVAYGLVNFTSIDKKNNKCMFGFYLGREDAPKGSGSIMEFLALDYAFLKINARKLSCEVLSFNAPPISLHKKFGFHEEGCLKQHIIKNDAYHDIVQLALFKEQWLEHRKFMTEKLFKGNK